MFPFNKQLYINKEVIFCHRFYESLLMKHGPWSMDIRDLQLAIVGPRDVNVQ